LISNSLRKISKSVLKNKYQVGSLKLSQFSQSNPEALSRKFLFIPGPLQLALLQKKQLSVKSLPRLNQNQKGQLSRKSLPRLNQNQKGQLSVKSLLHPQERRPSRKGLPHLGHLNQSQAEKSERKNNPCLSASRQKSNKKSAEEKAFSKSSL